MTEPCTRLPSYGSLGSLDRGLSDRTTKLHKPSTAHVPNASCLGQSPDVQVETIYSCTHCQVPLQSGDVARLHEDLVGEGLVCALSQHVELLGRELLRGSTGASGGVEKGWPPLADWILTIPVPRMERCQALVLIERPLVIQNRLACQLRLSEILSSLLFFQIHRGCVQSTQTLPGGIQHVAV